MNDFFGKLEDSARMIEHPDPGRFKIVYSMKGFGFGGLEFMLQPDGSTLIDDECTNKETIKLIMGIFIDQAETWSERQERLGDDA